MDDPHEDVPGEILNRHAATLRGLALAERRYGDRAPHDDIGAAVKPAVDRDRDRASGGGRCAWHGRFLIGEQDGAHGWLSPRFQGHLRRSLRYASGGRGSARRFNPCLAVPLGLAARSDGKAVSRSPRGAPMPTPPYQFIAIARTIARGFTEQAIGHPDGEALTEAAQAIWRGIEVLEGMDRRERPSTARSMRPARRSLSAAPVPAR